MGCDTSCITLSWVTEISLSTQRMLAVLLESLELVPAEDVVHCVHLERPVNSEAPKLSKISKLKNRVFFSESKQTGGSTYTCCKYTYCSAASRVFV